MSWGAQIKIVNGAVASKTVQGLESKEHKEQYEVAQEALAVLFDSGAVGSPDKTYSVTFSGHGNPDHEPAPGWANDFVQISISQVST